MRVNYTIIIGIFLLLFLYFLSGSAKAQTASSKPLSSVITPAMQQQLDLKKGNNTPVDPVTAQEKLPGNKTLPKQAEDAKKMKPVTGTRPASRPAVLPGTAPVDVDEIKRRNFEQARKSNSNQRQ